VSNEPRVWNEGDPEPEYVAGRGLKVQDNQGDVWTYNDRNGFWYTPDTKPYPWEHIARKWGPLVEVLPDPTPETAVEQGWSRHGHWLGDDGPTPESGPPGGIRADCGGPSGCKDCAMDQVSHDLHAATRVPPVSSGRGATNPPSPVSGEAKGSVQDTSGELRASGLLPRHTQLLDSIADNLFAAIELGGPAVDHCRRALAVIRDVRLLALASWRPPLPVDTHGVGSLSEAIGLALNDAYAGIEFEDPTFERGTDAVMQVLREWEQGDQS
jgi:hypothetical protein